ncbi:MAG: DUF5666 domain-containing protein [Terriglobia bacterium]|jgi:hypothetical protein
MRRAALFLLTVVFLLFMAGCGSQSSVTTTPPSNPNPAVSLTVTDTPPAGVTVLFFQLSITGASLSPGGVSLLSSTNPIPVNVSQLQTDSAFLGSTNVPAGTYTSLSVTFSNPQLTIYNGSGATIGSGANVCANNSVCQLTPSTTPLTLTFSTAPFPVTLTANSPLAFQLDIHLDTVIQPDLTVNLAATNGVTISQLPAPPSGTPITALGNLTGTVQGGLPYSVVPNPDQVQSLLVLQTGDGRTFDIGLTSSTTYSYPSSVCSANNFACLATGQIVKVELSLPTDGTLLASEVDYVQPAGQTVVEGNIIRLSTSAAGAIMDMILQQGPPTPTPNALPFGQRVTVTVPASGVTYTVDSGSFTIPGGLSFATYTDLVVGQEVSVVVVPGSLTTASGSGSSTPWAGPAATTFTTNSITLEPSQITGSVPVLDASALSFWLSTNPNYFIPPATPLAGPPTPAPVNITVQTTSGTTFTNFTPDSISGLAVNDVVSVGGWLFSSGVIPFVCTPTYGCVPATTIVAESVVGRPGPTPLF